MNILFLTDNFYPETNAPAKRTLEHCKEWSSQGHNITIITGAPNFPKGKVFDGYKNKIYQSELINNLNVKRVWTFIAANEGFANTITNSAAQTGTAFTLSTGIYYLRGNFVTVSNQILILDQYSTRETLRIVLTTSELHQQSIRFFHR